MKFSKKFKQISRLPILLSQKCRENKQRERCLNVNVFQLGDHLGRINPKNMYCSVDERHRLPLQITRAAFLRFALKRPFCWQLVKLS